MVAANAMTPRPSWARDRDRTRWAKPGGWRLLLRADGRLVEWVPSLRAWAVRVLSSTTRRAAAEAERRGYKPRIARGVWVPPAEVGPAAPLVRYSTSRQMNGAGTPLPDGQEERIRLYERRAAKNLDLFTGERVKRDGGRMRCAGCGRLCPRRAWVHRAGWVVRAIDAPGCTPNGEVDGLCPKCVAAGLTND